MKDSGDFENSDNELELDGGFSMSPDADVGHKKNEGSEAQTLNPRGGDTFFDDDKQEPAAGDHGPDNMTPDQPEDDGDLNFSGGGLSLEGEKPAQPQVPSQAPAPDELQMSQPDDMMPAAQGGELSMQPDTAQDMPAEDPTEVTTETSEDTPLDAPPAHADENPAENHKVQEEDKLKNMRLGDRLIVEGHIDQDQLEVALHEKNKSGGLLGEILVELGFITPDILAGILAESTGYEEYDPGKSLLDSEALALVDKATALRFQILPVSLKDGVAHIAMADPYDVMTLDRLRQMLPRGITIQPMIGPPATLNTAIDRAYGYASSTKDIMSELAGKKIDLEGIEGLTEDNAYSHPIVRLVNALVIDAVKMGASDLHFEPEENFVRLRYRVDGILITVQTLHKEYWQAIAQRLKIMSGMNIADKLLPQDGRFFLSVGGREADFRVSSLPTVNGENFVLRVLDKQSGILPLSALGFSDHNMNLIRKSQSRPEGIIIVTGPTGSGKTTSLYSMLNAVNTPDVNIMTLEDPVEYSLPMIRQTHVRGGAGLTFADGVKALLRQDPDIIFVGEVRDAVTAEQALKAAMTGHQVYTSLHTNDCFGAIPRLLDLGLQPGMLAGAIIASFAQRLVRRLCDCKETKTATEEECRLLGIDATNPPEICHPKGCAKCGNSGYKGRTAVVEILFTNEAINDVIADGGGKTQLKKVAREHGFKSMLDDGVDKILKGMTSIEALMKSVDFSDRL